MFGQTSLRLFLLMLLVTLAASIIGHAQQVGSSDPLGDNSSPGTSSVLGLPLHEPDTPPDRVNGHSDGGKRLEFKSQTTLVQVPVIVTDSTGAHIHQLSKTDFKVMENGKAQHIVTFEEIIPGESAVSAAFPTDGTYSNVPSKQDKVRPVTVIVLDEINTPF